MKVQFIITIFGHFFGYSDLVNIPELKGHHAYIGYYPKVNMDRCGFLNPKDVASSRTPKTRIINGDLASLGEFPWQVTIFHKFRDQKTNHLCDGVLIHKYWVLTAKHCVNRKRPGDDVILANYLKLSFGTIDARVFREVRNVTQIVNHPQLNIDLSLLRLEKPMEPLTSADGSYYLINQICLPKENSLNLLKEEAINSGFGDSSIWPLPPATPSHPPNKLLRKAIINIESAIECTNLGFSHWQICAVEEEHMTCHGDSGSGLVQFDGNRAMLIGTVVGGKFDKSKPDCSPGLLFYLRISYFIGFLRDVIEYNITSFQTSIPLKFNPFRTANELNTSVETPSDKQIGSNAKDDNQDQLLNRTIIALNILTILLNLIIY